MPGPGPVTFPPRISTFPEQGKIRPASRYSKVVLPHPDGPITARVPPFSREKEMSSRTLPAAGSKVLLR